jgi:hypothetical protein
MPMNVFFNECYIKNIYKYNIIVILEKNEIDSDLLKNIGKI